MSEMVAVCAVCGERINTIECTQNGETTCEWRHGATVDHEPIPAPADLTEAVLRCDFCSALNPVWSIATAKSFAMVTVFEKATTTNQDNGSWAACPPCKRFVAKRDLDRLVHRAMLLIRRSFPDRGADFLALAEKELRDFYMGFFLDGPSEPTRIAS